MFEKLVRLQRYERIFAPQIDDTIVVTHLRNLLPHQPIAKAPELEAIEVADEFVHQLRPRGRGGS